MKSPLIFATLLLASCDISPLHEICDVDCVIVADGTVYTGEEAATWTCHLGKMTCHQQPDGTVSTPICVGSSLPQPEKCPYDPFTGIRDPSVVGVDSDCSGIPNDLVLFPGDSGNPCEQTQLGVCKQSTYECRSGEMVCVPPAGLYGTESCDSLDNDCNDQVDEGLAPIFTYNADPSTLGNGDCRPQITACKDGRWQVVQSEIDPQAPGNTCAEDLNCDGVPDGSTEAAFALMLDVSDTGMSVFLDATETFLCDSTYQAQLSTSQFAILLVAVRLDPLTGELCGLDDTKLCIQKLTDFVPITTACQLFSAWHATAFYDGAYEYFAKGVEELNRPNTDGVQITWPDSLPRRVIMASDESPMSYESVIPDPDPSQVVEDCGTFGFTTGVFTSPLGAPGWTPLTQGACAGWIDDMVPYPTTMAASIATRFTSCN